MWNEPDKEKLATIPRLYETEKTPLKEKLIHIHFFIGGCDWYIAEYDGEDLFWGFAILNGDYEMAEWGYISFSELKSIKIQGWLEIDCDLYWEMKKASEIEKIRKASGWEDEDTKNLKQKLIRKVRDGHFPHFQNLFSEVTSPNSEFFGIDPYPIWKSGRSGARGSERRQSK